MKGSEHQITPQESMKITKKRLIFIVREKPRKKKITKSSPTNILRPRRHTCPAFSQLTQLKRQLQILHSTPHSAHNTLNNFTSQLTTSSSTQIKSNYDTTVSLQDSNYNNRRLTQTPDGKRSNGEYCFTQNNAAANSNNTNRLIWSSGRQFTDFPPSYHPNQATLEKGVVSQREYAAKSQPLVDLKREAQQQQQQQDSPRYIPPFIPGSTPLIIPRSTLAQRNILHEQQEETQISSQSQKHQQQQQSQQQHAAYGCDAMLQQQFMKSTDPQQYQQYQYRIQQQQQQLLQQQQQQQGQQQQNYGEQSLQIGSQTRQPLFQKSNSWMGGPDARTRSRSEILVPPPYPSSGPQYHHLYAPNEQQLQYSSQPGIVKMRSSEYRPQQQVIFSESVQQSYSQQLSQNKSYFTIDEQQLQQQQQQQQQQQIEQQRQYQQQQQHQFLKQQQQQFLDATPNLKPCKTPSLETFNQLQLNTSTTSQFQLTPSTITSIQSQSPNKSIPPAYISQRNTSTADSNTNNYHVLADTIDTKFFNSNNNNSSNTQRVEQQEDNAQQTQLRNNLPKNSSGTEGGYQEDQDNMNNIMNNNDDDDEYDLFQTSNIYKETEELLEITNPRQLNTRNNNNNTDSDNFCNANNNYRSGFQQDDVFDPKSMPLPNFDSYSDYP